MAFKHKGKHGGGGRGAHRGGGRKPAKLTAFGHEMTPDQELADRMANRGASSRPDLVGRGGGALAGPGPTGISAAPGLGIGENAPPGQVGAPLPPMDTGEGEELD